jgi:hypothetical protein
LYKLTLSDQAQVTLQLRVSLSDLVYFSRSALAGGRTKPSLGGADYTYVTKEAILGLFQGPKIISHAGTKKNHEINVLVQSVTRTTDPQESSVSPPLRHRVPNIMDFFKTVASNIIFFMKGPRTTALRLFVQPYDEDKDEQFFLPSFTSNGAPVE